jgi:hypothetical protein
MSMNDKQDKAVYDLKFSAMVMETEKGKTLQGKTIFPRLILQ